ncbi:hypothetical protein Poli38472_003651 [Pythium oligandrum]|uniref:Uncharacterized protein n=1 Tax=Pythium oligandrum TaxID=41045 RepID=A0A8K1CLL2_PYTOL|nr:hypothetical protein Poli38472_003651 [Pythium oligandrum]|eukprot:TMW65886.1 hypothetical protein Poli38472_003651 [Pythium oligandrum]
MEATGRSPSREGAFITEVNTRVGTPQTPTFQRRRTGRSSTTQLSDKDNGGIRGVEKINSQDAASDVFRIIDKMGEKQQHSRNIRSLIQKAAQKTILVVRTKNATQAAENVTVRFHKNQMTEVPRSVQLRYLCSRVLDNLRFTPSSANDSSVVPARKRRLFQEIFTSAPEVNALLKDMFWYLTAHCFQPGRQLQQVENFYQRIADNFTTLFIRVQVQSSSRDCGFFDKLPDVLAQILFMALYEAFPKSRKHMMSPELRREILRKCYGWILGFVPAELSWSHWMPVDQESPKRIAALADFPAMRNRMLRAERIERTKLEVKNRHSTVLDEEDDTEDMSEIMDEDGAALPPVHNHASSHHPKPLIETRERCVYQMQNSPLVEAFLKRHHLQANANQLQVQLRLTSGKNFELQQQEALKLTTLPRQRRRRLVNPKAYAEALDQIETFGNNVRATYAAERKTAHDQTSSERRQVVSESRDLDSRFEELKHHSAKMHEYSNLLVSQGRIDALVPRKKEVAPPKSSPQYRAADGKKNLKRLTPHPPPPRSNQV